jgi:alpha/beta superfamily hydrolase
VSIQRVLLPSEFPLEGLLHEKGKRAGVVICHPHPLYGGSMYNSVVDAIESGFSAKGLTTLRFNFRGVGGSAGEYDEGEGEVNDVMTAVAFLKRHIDGDAGIALAGYSFGAWMASRAAARIQDVGALFLVAYPFAFYGADELKLFRKRIYLIGGEYDDISPIESLLKVYKELPVPEKNLKIIPTDHFYGGKEGEIAEFIEENFEL